MQSSRDQDMNDQQQQQQGKQRKRFKEVNSRYLSYGNKTSNKPPTLPEDTPLQPSKVAVTPRERMSSRVIRESGGFRDDVTTFGDDGASCSSFMSQVTQGGQDSYQSFLRLLQLQHFEILFWRYAKNLNQRLLQQGQKEALHTLTKKVDSIVGNQEECGRLNTLLMQHEHDQTVDQLLDTLLQPLEQWAHVNNEHKVMFYEVIRGMESLMMNMPLVDGAVADQQTLPQSIQKLQGEILGSSAALVELLGDTNKLKQSADLIQQLVDVFKEEERLITQCTLLSQQFKDKQTQNRCLQCIHRLSSEQTSGQPPVNLAEWL